jgi:hypothetical protein
LSNLWLWLPVSQLQTGQRQVGNGNIIDIFQVLRELGKHPAGGSTYIQAVTKCAIERPPDLQGHVILK